MPEISVVIPAHNSAITLRETLESVLAQTLQDLEVIVIDDGSTDDTATLAVSTDDPRVRVVSVPNGGVSRARNIGIEESKANLIAFLDADDLWEPEKLQRQLSVLNSRAEVGICVTGAISIDSASRPIAPLLLFAESDDYTRDLLLNSNIAGCVSSSVVRRELLQSLNGFTPGLEYCEDWSLWLQLTLRSEMGVIAEPLVRKRIHAGNTSGNPFILERDTFIVLESFFATPDASRYAPLRAQAYGAQWMICAGSYLHKGNPINAVRCLAHSISSYPAGVTYALRLPFRWLQRATRARKRAV
jgi:glycosyltransferase involved in cell wall biosynthesis